MLNSIHTSSRIIPYGKLQVTVFPIYPFEQVPSGVYCEIPRKNGIFLVEKINFHISLTLVSPTEVLPF